MTLVALATLHLAFARPMSQSVVATPPKVQALLDRLESEQAFSSYRSRSTLEKVLEAFPREQGLSTEESVHFYCGLYQTPGAFGRSSQLPSGTGDWLLDHLTYRSGRGASVQLAYLRSEALPSCISTLLQEATTSDELRRLVDALERLHRHQASKSLAILTEATQSTRIDQKSRSYLIKSFSRFENLEPEQMNLMVDLAHQFFILNSAVMSEEAARDVLRTLAKKFYYQDEVMTLFQEVMDGAPGFRSMKQAVDSYLTAFKTPSKVDAQRDAALKQNLAKRVRRLTGDSTSNPSEGMFSFFQESDTKATESQEGLVAGLGDHMDLLWVRELVFELIASPKEAIRYRAAEAIQGVEFLGKAQLETLVVERYPIETSARVKKSLAKSLARVVLTSDLPSQTQVMRKFLAFSSHQASFDAMVLNQLDSNAGLELAGAYAQSDEIMLGLRDLTQNRSSYKRLGAYEALTEMLARRFHFDSPKAPASDIDRSTALGWVAQALGDQDRSIREKITFRLQYLIETFYVDSGLRRDVIELVSPNGLAKSHHEAIRKSRSDRNVVVTKNRLEQGVAVFSGMIKGLLYLGNAGQVSNQRNAGVREQAGGFEIEQIQHLLQSLETQPNP